MPIDCTGGRWRPPDDGPRRRQEEDERDTGGDNRPVRRFAICESTGRRTGSQRLRGSRRPRRRHVRPRGPALGSAWRAAGPSRWRPARPRTSGWSYSPAGVAGRRRTRPLPRRRSASRSGGADAVAPSPQGRDPPSPHASVHGAGRSITARSADTATAAVPCRACSRAGGRRRSSGLELSCPASTPGAIAGGSTRRRRLAPARSEQAPAPGRRT